MGAGMRPTGPQNLKRSSDGSDLTKEMMRVLAALCRAAAGVPGGELPLRRLATAELNGDSEQAARVLIELDVRGYVRTDTMGWLWGWVTARGRAAAREVQGTGS